jgi:hypothetical protein
MRANNGFLPILGISEANVEGLVAVEAVKIVQGHRFSNSQILS